MANKKEASRIFQIRSNDQIHYDIPKIVPSMSWLKALAEITHKNPIEVSFDFGNQSTVVSQYIGPDIYLLKNLETLPADSRKE